MSKSILGRTQLNIGTLNLTEIVADKLEATSSIKGDYLTASKGLATNADKKIVSTTASSAEIDFLTGATSNIQTQLNAKQPIVSLTANRVAVSDGSGDLTASSITTTELDFLDGVSSNIQTQITANASAITSNTSAIATKQPEIDSSNRLDATLIGVGNVDNQDFAKLTLAGDNLSATIPVMLNAPQTYLIQAGSNLAYNTSTTPPTLNATDTDTNFWDLASNVITNNNSSDVVVATTFKNKINTNSNAHIGRGLFGYSGNSGQVGMQNIGLDVNGSNYAIQQNGNGKTMVNSSTGQRLDLCIDDSEALTISSSGLVGIGTNDPRSALHVQGNMNANSLGVHIGQQGNNSAIEIVSGDTDSAFIDFTKASADKRGRIIYYLSNDSMSIETNNVERIKIDSGGKVGIGTATPNNQLHIKSSLDGNALIQGTGLNYSAYLDLQNTARSEVVGGVAGYYRLQSFGTTARNGDFAIQKMANDGGSVNSEPFTINSAGNVGIGTTSPPALLSLDVRFLFFTKDNPDSDKIGASNKILIGDFRDRFTTTSTLENFVIQGGDNGSQALIFTSGGSFSQQIRNIQGWDTLASRDFSRPISLQVLGGNVGIGTATPAELLHVNGVCRASSFTTTSDDRVKHFEKPTTDCLTKIMSLKPTTYQKSNELYDISFVLADDKSNLKEGDELRLEVGFIAQEVKASIYEEFSSSVGGGDFMDYPVVVDSSDNVVDSSDNVVVEEEPAEKVLIEQEYTLNYNNIFVVAVGAIQELKAEIDTLKERIAVLEQ